VTTTPGHQRLDVDARTCRRRACVVKRCAHLGNGERPSSVEHDDMNESASQREYVLGQGLRAVVLATAEETEGRHDLTDTYQPPGEQTPLHVHTRYEERFWVVSGELQVWAGPAQVILRSGDYYVIGRNVPHAVRSGPEGAHALHISTPAAFAELIARSGTPAHLATPETRFDEELFMAVTTELGDVVLGPPGTLPADVEPGARGSATPS
jgi:mannose-6-phosphate isomerase-like protein (cupin superfamily)